MRNLVLEAAGSGGSAWVIALVVGVVVVVGLIAAFVLGSRRKEKEPPPTLPDPSTQPGGPDGQAPGPAGGSWSTPPSTPGRAPRGEDTPH
jgi:hypothetical protein